MDLNGPKMDLNGPKMDLDWATTTKNDSNYLKMFYFCMELAIKVVLTTF